MRVFVTKPFARFTKRERIRGPSLWAVVREMEAGSFDADLGGGLFKQRIARLGKGKSGGYRAVIAFRHGKRLVFLVGFAKNEKSNISPVELGALKTFAAQVIALDEAGVERLLHEGQWKELGDEEETEGE